MNQIKTFLQDLANENSALRDNFNKETINELVDKVGLNEETASRIKDLSLDKYISQIKSTLSELESKFDMNNIMGKIKVEHLEENAREVLKNLSKIFNKEERS